MTQRTQSMKINYECANNFNIGGCLNQVQSSIQASDFQKSSNTMIINDSGIGYEDANRLSLGDYNQIIANGYRGSSISRQAVNQNAQFPISSQSPSAGLGKFP